MTNRTPYIIALIVLMWIASYPWGKYTRGNNISASVGIACLIVPYLTGIALIYWLVKP